MEKVAPASKRRLWPLGLALALGWAPVGASAQGGALAPRRDAAGAVVSARGSVEAPAGSSAEARAAAYLARDRARLGVAPGLALAPTQARSAHGFDVVRFVPRAAGRRVLGGSVVVRMRGSRVDYVALSGVDLDAVAAARLSAPPASAIPRQARVLEVEAVALRRGERLAPAFAIDLAGVTLAERERVIVSAESGLVLGREPRSRDALGRVYARDPLSDDEMTTDVELTFLTSNSFLTGRYFRVASCNATGRGCDPQQTAVADAAGDFLIDPNEPSFDDPFAEVHAYHHANRVAEYFRDVHDFTWTCGDDEIMRLFVNYSESAEVPFDNAAYSPSGGGECGFMLFGQGQLVDFAYDADVIYHEFGHAVLDLASDVGSFAVEPLGVSYEPGALNEGIADYFSSTLAGDPELAEYFARSPGAGEGALRRLDNTLTCPGGLIGESHFDGRLIGGLGWELREAHGAEAIDALMFVAAISVDSSAGLADMADAIVATAETMAADGVITAAARDDIRARTEARGLIDCRRIAPLDGGVSRRAFSGISDLTAGLGASIAPVHYRIDVPADATALTVRFERETPNGTYRVHFSDGEPVRVANPRVFSDFDLPADGNDEVKLRIDREPGLPRCTTLYMAVAIDDLTRVGNTLYVVSAELTRSNDPAAVCAAPDAGAADAGALDAGIGTVAGGGGCACGVAGRPAREAPWALAALVGLAFVIRRLETAL